MSECNVSFDTTGIVKMVKSLGKMGKSPQKAVTRAASKGITPVRRAVRSLVPVGETGTLRRAITRKAEKSRAKGKKVFEVTLDRAYNDMLQKEIKRPGIYGGKSSKGYYPASQEYGYLTRRKDGSGLEYRYGRQFKNYTNDLADWYSKHGDDRGRSLVQTKASKKRNSYVEIVQGVENRKVEGQHYMLKGAEQSEAQSKQIIVDTMEKELDKLWQEAQHE